MGKKYILLGLLLSAGAGYTTEIKGIRPHASRADYNVTCFTEDIGVGASLVNSSQVRRLFGPEIDGHYIVVEVGFYSKHQSPFEVRHADFRLRNRPSRTIVKPIEAKDVISQLSRPIQSLIETSLPEATTSQALAGYLLFPITDDSASFYELDYTGYGAWLTLPLKP